LTAREYPLFLSDIVITSYFLSRSAPDEGMLFLYFLY
jgi:hypothetical protein